MVCSWFVHGWVTVDNRQLSFSVDPFHTLPWQGSVIGEKDCIKRGNEEMQSFRLFTLLLRAAQRVLTAAPETVIP